MPRRNTRHATACTFLSSPVALRDKPYPLPNARGALAFRMRSMPPLRSAHGQALRSRDRPRPDYLLAFWQRRGVTVIGADDATDLFASCTRHGQRSAPPFAPYAGALSTLVPWRGSNEQQPFLETQLQDKINEHNRQHGSKPKGVSNKTMHERACSLSLLHAAASSRISDRSQQLAGRHIQMLVDYWTGNARIADRCRQRGVEMLERPHSTAYIEQQLSFLRVYADTWIGSPAWCIRSRTTR